MNPEPPSGTPDAPAHAWPRRSGKPLWQSRTLRYTLIIVSALSGVLLFLLASASGNTPLFERHYPVLLGLNVSITVAMAVLIAVLVRRLIKRYRTGVFGTRLLARLALSFALMGVIPGALIYFVSVQFLSRSIESWFDVRVDKALESGLALGRATLDSLLTDLNAKARGMALELSDVPEAQQAARLNHMREQAGASEAILFTGGGRILSSVGSGQARLLGSLAPNMPSSAVLRQLRVMHSYSGIESASDSMPDIDPNGTERNLRMRVIVAVPSGSYTLLQSETRYIQVTQAVPAALAVNAVAVQDGVRDYQELSLSRTGLQKIYSVTLTLTLLLSMFAALAVAYLLSNWLSAPLLLLAEGTKAVAGGDFRPMRAIDSPDELGTLTQSFNAMTRQLDDARATVEANQHQLENAKAYLESILANLSAGVLVFDDGFRLATANHGAERILGVDLTSHLGTRLGAVPGFDKLDQAIARAFAEHGAGGATPAEADWQMQLELPQPGRDGANVPEVGGIAFDPLNPPLTPPLTLLARGSRCPVGNAQGYLVVFDDVSDVISAQRSIAWGEVARRLAHEIKNPLTPIQLSAERLLMKLGSKLPAADAAVLERGVTTIVNQVTAMKNMVDDFREYAKAPPAVLVATDLNALVAEIMTLYGDGADDSVSVRLAADLPPILGDATRLRQVIHNLVQNAQDAAHDPGGVRRAQIVVATERIAARQPDGREDVMARLTVTDNGGGFPARILARAFEPYVTTKARGTGLGLAMVKKIADEHEARVDLRNVDGGASVAILFTRIARSAPDDARRPV